MAILVFFAVATLTLGYIDYCFYEKSAPKIIAQLLDKDPLLNFQRIGFVKDGGDILEGTINSYKVILSPMTNIENNNLLTVSIPLQIREGLENYFWKYNDNFRFSLSDRILFAEAVLKDYEKRFGFNELFQLIDMTVLSLKENKIEPLNILNEQV